MVLLLTHIFNTRFKSFEDYLDSLVIEDDQKFLKDVDTARVIAQLGYRLVWYSFLKCVHLLLRSSGKTLSEEEFQQLKEEIAVSRSFGKARKEVLQTKTRPNCCSEFWHGQRRGHFMNFQILAVSRCFGKAIKYVKFLVRLPKCLKHSFNNWLFVNPHHHVQS